MPHRIGAPWASAALVAGVLGIAWSPVLVRLSELGPSATAVHRVALALPFLFAWMAWERRGAASQRPARLDRGDWGVLALAGLFWTGDLVFWHWAITWTSVANANFLSMSAPFFVTLGALLLYGERITRGFVAGLALALAGGLLLVGSSLTLARASLLGDAMGLATALCFAGYLLAVKKLRGKLPAGTVMALSGALSLPGLLAAALASGESLLPETGRGWLVLVALALSAQAVGQSFIALAMAHLPAAMTSAGLLLQPVLAALFAWAILAEALTLGQALGGAVVLAGVYVARRYGIVSRVARPAATP